MFEKTTMSEMNNGHKDNDILTTKFLQLSLTTWSDIF